MSDVYKLLVLLDWKHIIGINFSRIAGRNKSMYKAYLKKTYGTRNINCWICGDWVTYGEINIDHVIPKSIVERLGRDDLILAWENLKPSHEECNHKRATPLLHELGEEGFKVLRGLGIDEREYAKIAFEIRQYNEGMVK